jgi:protein SCO1/2
MKRFALLTAVAVAFFALVWIGAKALRPYTFHGTVIQSPEPAPAFTLQSADGPVSPSDFEGQVVVLFFGYTFCPDVCPTTLADLAGAMRLLGDEADDVQVVFVSVDPARDTPERLAEYVSSFDPRFIGITGTEAEVAAAAAVYGIFYEKHEGTPASGYLVDHTATAMVIDRKGRLKLVLPFGTGAQDIAADLHELLQ